MPLRLRPCRDSDGLATAARAALDIDRSRATRLGRSAVEAAREGRYVGPDGSLVDIAGAVTAALRARVSIPPEAALPATSHPRQPQTVVTVANESTLVAARRLVDAGRRPLALNMASGISPGGGFLHGARAQEETLCRSSALHATLLGDPMYAAHRNRDDHESSDWVILSPDVPVFRRDDGTAWPEPWLCSFISSAAPVAHRTGQPRSGDLLRARIARVLSVAHAYGFDTLVLGAWGCGAFGNDPQRTATDFRRLLAYEFDGAFAHVAFAISDWSPQRRFLGPFCAALSA